jgi:eukaryotic-like serine/threonine-protein kinase
MARQTHRSEELPACPTGAGVTAQRLYRLAADTLAAEAVRETRDNHSEGSSTSDGCSVEGRLSTLHEQLRRFPGRPIDVGRYRVLRCLGEGGMGVVYEAVTRDGSRRVALKTLKLMNARGLYHFKTEFRAVQRVAHPNLVNLHELVSEKDDEWFFTMEFLEGTSFLAHVRADVEGARRPGLGATKPIGQDESEDSDGDGAAAQPSAVAASAERGFDEARLRDALRQLASGVAALHEAGKVHRDLNPNNVFVTPAGRVVVLDFGLIGSVPTPGGEPDSFARVGGTPGYMAPEQQELVVSAASDWYALGIMIYEALTGQLPYDKAAVRALAKKPGSAPRQDRARKQPPAPRPPSELAAGVPADLEALCLELIRPSPLDRPSGAEVLRRLGVPRDARAPRAATPSWVGRGEELGALEAALSAVAAGRLVTAWVHGPSGIGKTALLRRFGALAAERHGAQVLMGSCYERETLPYNAVDALIDTLTHALRALPLETATALLPPDILDLARLFPVLQGASAVASTPRRRGEGRDPDETRRRAFACLRALLKRLGTPRPLVLCLDDLQWGDVESARLLVEVLGSRGDADPPPPLLLVGAYRSDEAASSALLRELRGPRGAARERLGPARDLALGPLAPGDALALALTSAASPAAAEAIAAAAEGNPFMIEELGRCSWAPGEPSLEALMSARIDRLPAAARRLLEVVAVAGRPVQQGVAVEVAAVGAEAPAALQALRAGRFVRVHGPRGAARLEVAHDRLRAAALARIEAPALAGYHLGLGRALEAGRSAESEVLALHFHEAGRFDEAGDHAANAAGHAAATLAFDHAADLYGRALALGARTPRLRRELTERRADALAAAGRPTEAAPLYLTAAEGAPPAQAIDLRRCAAEQLLVSGRVREGLDVLRPVLTTLGIELPGSDTSALAALGLRLGRLRLRGVRLRERSHRTSFEERARIAACRSVTRGLAGIAPVHAAASSALGLLLALDAGDARSASLGLAAAGAALVEQGVPAWGAELLTEARRLAAQSDEPAALAYAEQQEGVARFSEGRFRAALAHADAALALFRDRATGTRKEQSLCRALALRSLLALGDLTERARRALAWRRETDGAGDVFASTEAALGFAPLRLAGGEPERAASEVREALRSFDRELLPALDLDPALDPALAPGPAPGRRASLQHLAALALDARTALYQGLPREALRRLDLGLPALERAHLLLRRSTRVEILEIRGVASAAAAIREPDPRLAAPLLRAAEADAARLDGEHLRHTTAAAALIRAGLARARRQTDVALWLLRVAAAAYDAAEMKLHAASARHGEGRLLGGEAGHARVAAAEAVLEAEGVREPARWMGMLTLAIR